MTDEDSRSSSSPDSSDVWRQDEGSASGPSLSDSQPSLWRSDEGTMTSPRVTTKQESDVWRKPAPPPPQARPTNGASPTADPSLEEGQTPVRKKRRSRLGRITTTVILLVLLAFLGDLGYAAWRIKSSLDGARASLESTRAELSNGELDNAGRHLAEADESTASAITALDHPSIGLIRSLPVLNKDIKIVDAITQASELSVAAGRQGLRAVDALGVSEEGIAASIYSDGVVQIDELQTAMPPVQRAAELMSEAQLAIEGAPRGVLPPIVDAMRRARDAIPAGAETARKGAALMEVLPGLMGADGSKRYLLAFQATGEARATGGVIGMLGELQATDGAMELQGIQPYAKLFPSILPEAVEAPGWFERSYGPQFATRQWQQVNSSPNFPEVAKVLLTMYEGRTGKDLAGVIAMDPLALQEMMRATGPLVIEGGPTVTEENAADVLLRDSYVDIESRSAQDDYLRGVVSAFWDKISDGDFDGIEFARGISEAARTRHLMVYSTDGSAEEALGVVGVSGEYSSPETENVQMAFRNAYTVSKVDYFLREDIATDVRLSRQGDATVTTRMTMRNTAPDGPSSLLLGPGIEGDQPGFNRTLLNLLVPPSTQFESIEVDGQDAPVEVFRDEGHPVAWHLVEIPPGETVEVEVQYRILEAITYQGVTPRFDLDLVPQPLVTPAKYSLSIEAPSGVVLAEDFVGGSTTGLFKDAGTFDESKSYRFVLLESE